MEFLPAWPLTVTPLSSFGLLLLIGSLGDIWHTAFPGCPVSQVLCW